MSLTKIKKTKAKKAKAAANNEINTDPVHFSYEGKAKITQASTALVAKAYAPSAEKPSIKFEVKNEESLPTFQDSFIILKVATTPAAVTPRTILEIDYGFNLVAPEGYKFQVEIAPKYLEKSATLQVADYGDAIKVFLQNGGKEIIALEKGDIFGKAWVTPVVEFIPNISLEA